jgi:hypothetical protein
MMNNETFDRVWDKLVEIDRAPAGQMVHVDGDIAEHVRRLWPSYDAFTAEKQMENLAGGEVPITS